jgi:chitin disaccharide deacetylase
MERQLVVNADDLGLTIGVNDGIFDADAMGILTSASLFANAPATADAIRRARGHASLGIGAHLTLVDGEPVLPARDVRSLVGTTGRFYPSWKSFIVACLKGAISLVEVERELTAQVSRLFGAGVRLTHLDAHKHVHAYPPIFAIVARMAARFGIPTVRVPYEPFTVHALVDRGPARTHAAFNAAMWPWARRNVRTARGLGLRTPRFVGRIHTGILDRAVVRDLIRAVPPGVTELMVHPGYVDDALARAGTRLQASRQQELDLLCDLETRALVFGEQIDLVRHDLRPVVRRSFRYVS